MADPVDRDARVEQLLRRMPPVQPSSSCVDAEQLAAWSAGGLRRDQAALVERHLADCADCQVMLAAFVDSEPVAPAGAPFWQRWRLQWLVPVAAASVAVFAWTMVTSEPGGVPAPSTTVARAEPAEGPRFEAPASPAPAPRGIEAAPPASAPVAQPAEARMRQAADAAQPASPAPSSPVASAPSPEAVATDTPAAEKAEAAGPLLPSAMPTAAPTQSMASAAPPPPPPAAAQAAQARTASGQPAGAAATASAPITTQSGERSFAVLGSGRGQNNIMMDGISAMDATLPVHARIDASGPVDFRAPMGQPATQTAQAVAVEPPPLPTTWRIGLDGRVLRSRDFGGTWSAVAIDPALFITAGSAPVDGVCWLVDRGGAVLRSTNGVDFQRTAFAATASPVSILAVDASQATVVADDGRVFATADGGATWRAMP